MPKATIDDARIAEAAFYLWLEEGKPEGRDKDHWQAAKATLEAEVARPRKRAAAKPRAAKPKTAATKTADARPKAPRKAPAKKKTVN